MAGVIPRFTTGPVTYTVVETVRGGQMVEARAGGKVGVAADGSNLVLGVATKDAKPPGSPYGVDEFGNPTISSVVITEFVAVGHAAEYPVTFSEAAAFGTPLVASAAGQVRPYRATDPDGTGVLTADAGAHLIIGRCTEPNGVAAGAVGLARIF